MHAVHAVRVLGVLWVMCLFGVAARPQIVNRFTSPIPSHNSLLAATEPAEVTAPWQRISCSFFNSHFKDGSFIGFRFIYRRCSSVSNDHCMHTQILPISNINRLFVSFVGDGDESEKKKKNIKSFIKKGEIFTRTNTEKNNNKTRLLIVVRYFSGSMKASDNLSISVDFFLQLANIGYLDGITSTTKTHKWDSKTQRDTEKEANEGSGRLANTHRNTQTYSLVAQRTFNMAANGLLHTLHIAFEGGVSMCLYYLPVLLIIPRMSH